MRKKLLLLLIFSGMLLSSFKGGCYNSIHPAKDSIFDLAKLLLTQDHVVVPVGDHYINETIMVESFKKISGIVGKSRLIASPGFTGAILELDGVANVEISGISFLGNQSQFSKLSTICSSRDSIRQFEGRTYGIGIYIKNGSNECWISTCEFTGFGDACLKVANSGGRKFPIRISDVSMSKSFCGIDNYGTEYSPTVSVTVTDCVFGMILDAGNQFFSACSFNDNRIGLYIRSTHPNNSHGSFVACNFNHSAVFSIFSDGIDFGETFSGCHVFDGDVFLENSNGFVFTGGIIDAEVFVKGGKTNSINNTGFLTSYKGGEIHSDFEGSSSRLLLKNNFFLQEMGEKDSLLNN